MKIKKIVTMLLTILTLTCFSIVPVMASKETESFYVCIGGGSVVSSKAATKASGGGMWYSISEDPNTSIEWVQGVEVVNLRGRTNDLTACTVLTQRSNRGTGTMSYFSGYGVLNQKYRIAVQYDDSNPYEHLELLCSWIP